MKVPVVLEERVGRSLRKAMRDFLQAQRRLLPPFMNSPMGKGTMPDDDSLCVGAVRSTALREKAQANVAAVKPMIDDNSVPCNYLYGLAADGR